MLDYGKLIERKIKCIEEDIMEVSLDWVASDITFLQSENNYIKIVQIMDRKTPELDFFHYEVNDGKLTIVDGRKKKLKLRFSTPKIYLEIYLPKKKFKSISVKVVGGQLSFKDLDTMYCNCHVTSAKVTLTGSIIELDVRVIGCTITGENLEIQKMKVNSTSSKVQLSGAFSEVFTQTTGRSIIVHSLTMIKSFISTSTGANVIVGIPENEGFTLQFKKTASNLKSDFSLLANREAYTYKNGTNQLNAKLTGGRFTIYKV